MAAINKNFVIKNGLEVSTNLIFADAPKNRVGIGTTNPLQKFQIGNVDVSGISTDGKVFVVTSDAKVGIGTTNPLEKFQVGSGSSSFFVTTVGSVGLGITNPQYKLQVIGGIGVTDSFVTGISTVLTTLRVGTGGTVLTVLGVGNSIGIGTASPAFLLDIRSPVSTGQTALYIQGDVVITGDLSVDDITFDDATLSNLTVTEALNVPNTGIGTIVTFNSTNGTITNLTGTAITTGTLNVTTSAVIGAGITANASGINVTGIITATSFFGSGSGLTGVGLGTTGSINTSGIITATSFFGDGSGLTGVGLGTTGSINTSGIITATNGFVGNLTGTATSTTNIPNLTGAITSVNTTTSLGSFSSLDLATALTDETGSGSAVFATSPTLVTPVLGSATATSIVVGSGVTITGSGIDASAGIITASSFVGSAVTINSSGINVTGIATFTNASGTVKIGIGTTALLVEGNARVTGILTVGSSSITLNGSTNIINVGTGITINGSTGIISATSFSGSGANLTGVSAGSTVADDATTNATFYPIFTQTTSGTITASKVSTTKLNFNPSTGTLSATQFTSLSDETQKTDIQPIKNAITIVKQLQGVKYKWIDNHNQPSIGVIAQDIEKVLPEVVITNDKGLKSVSYGNIVGVLIEAIKEQQVRIEELERKSNA